MPRNDGGPAFPNQQDNTPGHEIYPGMTLRDYYKARAPDENND